MQQTLFTYFATGSKDAKSLTENTGSTSDQSRPTISTHELSEALSEPCTTTADSCVTDDSPLQVRKRRRSVLFSESESESSENKTISRPEKRSKCEFTTTIPNNTTKIQTSYTETASANSSSCKIKLGQKKSLSSSPKVLSGKANVAVSLESATSISAFEDADPAADEVVNAYDSVDDVGLSVKKIDDEAALAADQTVRELLNESRPSHLTEDPFVQFQENSQSDAALLTKYLYRIPNLRENIMWQKYIEAYYTYHRVKCFPQWIDPTKLKDLRGRQPEDPEFNFGHITVPQSSAKDDKMHFTPAMKQYWVLKGENFDKILLFKLGKFYELFYTDAAIAQQVLGLKWMGKDMKAHVGFPESSLHSQAKILIEQGFIVSVVEQMETPEELALRGSNEHAVKRSICEVFSKGCIIHEKMLGPLPAYECSIYIDEDDDNNTENTTSYSFVIVDAACGLLEYGRTTSMDGTYTEILNFLTQLAPKELILAKNKSKLVSLIQSTNAPPTIRQASKRCAQSAIIARTKVVDVLKHSKSDTKSFVEWISNHNSNSRATELIYEFLCDVMLAEQIFHCGTFKPYPHEKAHMILDAAAIDALRLVGSDSSLYAIINKCCTPMGQRLLRSWILRPNQSLEIIRCRQEAVEFLVNESCAMDDFKIALSVLPDVERQFGRLTYQMLNSKRGAVYFSDTIDKKIGSFVNFLNSLLKFDAFVSNLTEIPISAGRLHTLLKRLWPTQLKPVLASFMENIREINCGNYRPSETYYEAYTEADKAVELLKKDIEEYLASGRIWKSLGISKIHGNYVNAKYRYEVEVSEMDWRRIQKVSCDVAMTSSRKGFIRFQDGNLRTYTSTLAGLENAATTTLYPWLASEIERLHQYGAIITCAVSLISELDCLVSFGIYAQSLLNVCRPTFTDEPGVVDLEACNHPVLMNKCSHFVPNDILIGENPQKCRSIILTGPNMGGKSTLSRQVALLVIMAQIGCLVPAKRAKFSIYDRVFTRVGLRDVLAESKSTFLVELEEVREMLKYATKRSLLLIDEFGRGTNSKEGAVLACATLHYISHKIQCVTLFSTHFPIYKWIFDEKCHYGDKCQCIALKHLGAVVKRKKVVQVDESTLSVSFTYQLSDGVFPTSHGLIVARLAGIKDEVLAS